MLSLLHARFPPHRHVVGVEAYALCLGAWLVPDSVWWLIQKLAF